jgi:hypothetical protein
MDEHIRDEGARLRGDGSEVTGVGAEEKFQRRIQKRPRRADLVEQRIELGVEALQRRARQHSLDDHATVLAQGGNHPVRIARLQMGQCRCHARSDQTCA